jgi:hypothetical protein
LSGFPLELLLVIFRALDEKFSNSSFLYCLLLLKFQPDDKDIVVIRERDVRNLEGYQGSFSSLKQVLLFLEKPLILTRGVHFQSITGLNRSKRGQVSFKFTTQSSALFNECRQLLYFWKWFHLFGVRSANAKFFLSNFLYMVGVNNVMALFDARNFQNYWFESGGRPSALLQYLKSHALRNPEEYNKQQSIALSTLSSSADAKTLSDLGLLTQAGYLTLKKVVGTTAYLGYPNEEVRSSMAHLYTECLLAGRTVEQVGADNIAYRLAAENAESALHILNRLFSSIDYQHYPVKDESSVRAFIQVFFSGAGLTPIVEQHNHMGRSDLEVRAGNRYWVMEFKVCRKGQSSKSLLQEAVEQVCQNEYGKQVETGELIRVALVFSQEKRKFVEMAVC